MKHYYTEEDIQAFLNTKKGREAMKHNNNNIFKLAFEEWYRTRQRKRDRNNPPVSLEQFA